MRSFLHTAIQWKNWSICLGCHAETRQFGFLITEYTDGRKPVTSILCADCIRPIENLRDKLGVTLA